MKGTTWNAWLHAWSLILFALVLLSSSCTTAPGSAQQPPEPAIYGEPPVELGEGQRVTSLDADWDGFGETVALRGDVAVIGASEWNYFGEGYAYVYRRSDQGWQEEARLGAGDRSTVPPQQAREPRGQRFGSAVALGDNILAVGAPGTDHLVEGAVYTFAYNRETWEETAKLSPDPTARAPVEPPSWLAHARLIRQAFGALVALDGDTLAVGGDVANRALYVYQREANGWRQQAALGVPQRDSGDLYMVSMDLFGDTVALSVLYVKPEQPETDRWILIGQPVVYLFERDNGQWRQTLQYEPPLTEYIFLREPHLGAAVVLGGESGRATRLAIGIPGFPDLSAIEDLRDVPFLTGTGNHEEPVPGYPPSPQQVGTVLILERGDQNDWQQQALLTLAPQDQAPDPGFAFNSSAEFTFDEETLRETVFPGHIFSAAPHITFFGSTLDLDGDRLAVTSGFANTAHLFERQAGGPWRYAARIRPADGEVSEDYAQIIAASGDWLLLGAPGEFGNSAYFFARP